MSVARAGDIGVLADLIAKRKRDQYSPAAQERVTDAEVLGDLVASWSDWTGETIMATFLAALQESNYHSLADKLKEVAKADGMDLEDRL